MEIENKVLLVKERGYRVEKGELIGEKREFAIESKNLAVANTE